MVYCGRPRRPPVLERIGKLRRLWPPLAGAQRKDRRQGNSVMVGDRSPPRHPLYGQRAAGTGCEKEVDATRRNGRGQDAG